MKYDYLVFIGRFQPFHLGHAKIIETALDNAKKVIVLVGSSESPRSWRNPFVYDERASVILDWYREKYDTDIKVQHLTVSPLPDHTYNNVGWVQAVQTRVSDIVRRNGWTDYPAKIGLIGHSKDASSYYLSMFPQWGNIDVPAYTDVALFNSTDVRNVYFGGKGSSRSEWKTLISGVPEVTHRFLQEFRKTDAYADLYDGHQYILNYREDHAYRNQKILYDPSHTCVDACVVHAGHILLIERGSHPGKGLSALPGGFINHDETLQDAMFRELKEETKLKVPLAVLKGCIKDQQVFDDPYRSARGRIFSHTFLLELPPNTELPKIKGGRSSDAAQSWWHPLAELQEDKFFEDHYHIIKKMIAGR